MALWLSYFTDLQGSQTHNHGKDGRFSLVTLLIYKVLKLSSSRADFCRCLVTLLIYKVLKHDSLSATSATCLVTLLIYKVLKRCRVKVFSSL